MAPLAGRRALLRFFLCASFAQFLDLQPGSKLADGNQKKVALLP